MHAASVAAAGLNHNTRHSDTTSELPQRLRHSASATPALEALHKVSWAAIEPAFFAVTRLAALWTPTPDKRQHSIVRRLLALPLTLLAIVTLPLALLALPFYLLSHRHRRSFVYHSHAEVSGTLLLCSVSSHPNPKP